MNLASDGVDLIATFRAKTGMAKTVRDLILEYGGLVRDEPGNRFFVVYTDASDNAAFAIAERYVDQAAFDAKLFGEAGKEFNVALGDLIEGSGSELQLAPSASKGVSGCARSPVWLP
jgi:quinol monooxygenase YgiN